MKKHRNGNKDVIIDHFKLHIHVTNVLDKLTPSKVKKVEIDTLFPIEIVNSMSDPLKKDINETLKCYANCLWTATTLMCFRILEREIRNYLRKNYNVKDKLESIGACIEQFKKFSTNDTFLNNLERIKDLRNKGMYGEYRFSSEETKELMRTTFSIASWTNNIK
ncbi:hypothetical protein ES705_16405 [subsurface metagenome]